MSRIGWIFLFVLAGLGGYAQQESFVLIRSDNDQPFYVRLKEQTLSSSPQGHLILSQLKDSVYRITIGFPKKAYPEQDFYLVISGKDLGFELKYLDGRGWALFNMQTQEQEMPSRTDTLAIQPPLEGAKKDDAFSRLMAGVVNDTAVMYNTYAMEAYLRDSAAHPAHDSSAHPAPDSFARRDSATRIGKDSLSKHTDSAASGKADSALHPSPTLRPSLPLTPSPALIATHPDSTLRRPDSMLHRADPRMLHPDSAAGRLAPSSSITTVPPVPGSKTGKTRKTGLVEKLSEQQTPAALHLAYADHAKGHRTDTIEILIPRDSTTAVPATNPAKDSTKGNKGGPQAIHASDAGKDTRTDTPAHNTPNSSPPKEKPIVINTDCRNFASDEDVARLKVKLQALTANEARIMAAKKIFKLKCFSTNQLKELAELFTREEDKFQFLREAYPFVSDDRYGELSALFTDPVWMDKFKTMTGTK